jgi:putative two-component system response regulator
VPRALIVEDDKLIRHLLTSALRSGGYEVTAAADGAEAIAALNGDRPFDIVLTDYSMPHATGIEVIEHAARVDPSLPCIIITAFRDLELAMRAMSAGAVGFIPKPFKIDHLLTVVASALERRRLTREVARLTVLTPMLERFTLVLANTLEFKDCDTKQHSERLVDAADAVARELGLDEDDRTSVRLGACLHDIGKVGVPETILRKRGPLTAEELGVMKLHPDIGAAILEDIDTWHDVRRIVRHHHERWNGHGYPLGLAGTDIPLGARIVAVVDAYDVMRSGRVYSAPKSADVATAELVAFRGAQFDPDVVDAFLTTLTGTADYHDRVDHGAELHLLAHRIDGERKWRRASPSRGVPVERLA